MTNSAARVTPVLERGKGLKRRPLAPHPYSPLKHESIDSCRSLPHHETSQRRFAPMVIAIAPEC